MGGREVPTPLHPGSFGIGVTPGISVPTGRPATVRADERAADVRSGIHHAARMAQYRAPAAATASS